MVWCLDPAVADDGRSCSALDEHRTALACWHVDLFSIDLALQTDEPVGARRLILVIVSHAHQSFTGQHTNKSNRRKVIMFGHPQWRGLRHSISRHFREVPEVAA